MSSDVPGWNEPEYRPPITRYMPAADRVKAPAVFLIVLGFLNLLGACAELGLGMFFRKMPDEAFRRELWEKVDQEQKAELEQKGLTPEFIKGLYTDVFTYGGVVALVAGVFIVFGAARMLVLRSYGLAVVAAFVALVPGLACCCGVSQAIGIWALVVLLNSDVRMAFH
jgi:hypothetical protein